MASTSSDSMEDSSAASTAPSTTTSESSITNKKDAQEKPPDETSKIRMFLGILRKFIGVADIAAIRFSLPAQLLEPTPNLEYWNYLDQPNTFIAMGDSDDELGRMLEVLRFWYTKDLKYVKGKPCKPYNSTLGEFFRCKWTADKAAPTISIPNPSTAPSSSRSSIKSDIKSPASPQVSPSNPVTISYLTEQTSHHPPVSAFFVDCPEKGITARGFDQLSAKFTGTGIKVTPGEHNLGIFINLAHRDNEQYQLTHPAAHLGGLLRGSLSVTVGDHCYITCAKTRIKTILQYVEEGWLGKTQNKIEGVIFRYDPENDNKTRIRDVPEKDILARTFGSWREKQYYSLAPKFVRFSPDPREFTNLSIQDTPILLMDLVPLTVAPKILPPVEVQLPNESLRFWAGVTEAITAREFSRATTLKQEIEERQREKARQREQAGWEWQPRFFTGAVTPLGRPELTDEGKEVLKNLYEGKWDMKESEYTAS